MGKCCIKFVLVILTLLTAGKITDAQAQQGCVPIIANPAPPSEVLPYGAARTPERVHRGVDIMLEMCLPVNNQPGCSVMMYGTSPLWKTGGYGLYARYNCGPRVEVRYSHLNGWSEGRPINGRSGAARPTPPHIHYEVLVDRVRVDPQCVWGTHPNPSLCPAGLGNSPADMCNDTILEALKTNALNRYTDRPGGITSSMGMGGVELRQPSQVGPGPFEVDLPECPESDSSDGSYSKPVEHEHEGHDDLEEGGNLPVLQPPPYNGEPLPMLDPLPDRPGIKDGSPINLTPAPENDDNVPEKFSGCAADTWTAMVNQAVLQTRRQDLVNKRFIVKPDSVLDYSCFANRQNLIATQAAPIFSETQRWNNLTVDLIGDTETIKLQELDDGPPFNSETGFLFEQTYVQSNGVEVTFKKFEPQSLDMAIDSLVTTTTFPYLENNFMHGFLADTATVSGASVGTCNVMNQVWQASKCKNADGSGLFYTFEDLMSQDPREFPLSMPCF